MLTVFFANLLRHFGMPKRLISDRKNGRHPQTPLSLALDQISPNQPNNPPASDFINMRVRDSSTPKLHPKLHPVHRAFPSH